MKKIFALFNLKQLSVLLIALPYLAFNSVSIVQSPFFNISNLLLLFLALLVADVLLKLILIKIGSKYYTTISLFTAHVIIIFFYGFYISDYTQREAQNQFNLLIRGRTILEFITGTFIIILLFLKRNKIHYMYLNVFLVLFSITAFTSKSILFKTNTSVFYKSNYISIPTQNKSNKPVILIVSDEYTSPENLFNVYKDSSIYSFSNQLKSKGWIIKNSFYSYETSTIHSLSSMFNFNLSRNLYYGQEKIENLGPQKLIGAKLADSLNFKNINIINFGIFHLGKTPYLNRLYLYPASFIDQVFLNTIYYIAKSNTGNLNKSGLANLYYPMESHNKYIFNKLTDSLSSTKKTTFFAYVHLFMPHGPMQFGPDFPIKSENNLINYNSYWNFTNLKLNILLTNLIRDNKYKIILTGDHGYRGDKRINPHYTFTAFYGFEPASISNIKSVQDLGSLINGSF